MKKLLLLLPLLAFHLCATAIPAKPGQWRTVTLADGSEVKVQLTGDEHIHYWQAADGRQLVEQADGVFAIADIQQMTQRAQVRRQTVSSARRQAPRRVTMGERTNYTGQKKGLVILMQFKDKSFKTANNQAKYNDILNKENYNTSPFKGSVADYFKAQSGGQFELTFDVVGPYTAANDVSYYGANDSEGQDVRAEALVVEAVRAANDEVNFKDYDWDGDGEVDQVFVLYAGNGEADGGAANTIWPHMYYLSATNRSLRLDGVRIDTYACSNEVMPNGTIEGIGCFCHEFSHCLGFPDFYDTSYSGWYGTGDYDLMCGGAYNGNTYQPAGYTAYEKWTAGWLEPTVLDKDSVTVEGMKPLSDGGEAYVIYNDAHKDEYFLIENRQKVGWDTSLPSRGLMITHVDFDSQIWMGNAPNTKVSSQDAYYYGFTNDHQRYAIVRADNSSSAYNTNKELYPNGKRDSLTNTSTPKASLYNANTDGKKLLNKAVLNIKQNSDKTMDFLYRPEIKAPVDTIPTDTIPTDTIPTDTIPTDTIPTDTIGIDIADLVVGDTIFYESFNLCTGKGGNDDSWTSFIAQAKFVPDNEGWTYQGTAAYGGSQCARFGNGTTIGIATMPAVPVEGYALLTFRAAANWSADPDILILRAVTADGSPVTISPDRLTLPMQQWADFTVAIAANANVEVTFVPGKRFLIDEVVVNSATMKDDAVPGDANGDGIVDWADIATVMQACAASDGQNAGADVNGDGLVNVADVLFIIKSIAQ